MKVQRYSPRETPYAEMIPLPDGQYVRYEDYAVLQAQLEAIGAGGVDGRRLMGDDCRQRIEELEAELQELQRQWVEHDTLGCPTAKTGIYASEADRQRRGEPVAYLRAENLVRLAQPHVAGCAASIQKEPADGFIPIFTAPQPAEPVKVPSDDVLADALTNLEHHNYERSYSGYKNRQADVELIRAALAAMEQQT